MAYYMNEFGRWKHTANHYNGKDIEKNESVSSFAHGKSGELKMKDQ